MRAFLLYLLCLTLPLINSGATIQTLTLDSTANAVSLTFSNLSVGTDYEVQASTNLVTWMNQGATFTATNTSMVCDHSFAVTNYNQLFFRLQTVAQIIYNPVFFDADSDSYYILTVRGGSGIEHIEIDPTTQTQAIPFSLFDPDSDGFYTLSIIGNAGGEGIEIAPSVLMESDTVHLYNPDVGAYYNLTVAGTFGHEYLSIAPVP
jgi:hypothetical protein